MNLGCIDWECLKTSEREIARFHIWVLLLPKKWNRVISYFWLAKFEDERKWIRSISMKIRVISFWIQNALWNVNEIYSIFWYFWNVSKACICDILCSFPQRKHMYNLLISYFSIIYDLQINTIRSSDVLHSFLSIWSCKVFQNHANSPKSDK